MEKHEILKDGTRLSLRHITMDDIDELLELYRSLPIGDRKYLRVDITNRSVVEQRIRAAESGQAVRICALHNDKIIATGALELFHDDWRRKLGEIRVIVSKEFQRKGLGIVMMRELYPKALEHKVEKIVAKIMRPQVGVRTMLRKLGFHEELLLPDYVQDLDNKSQDLLIMTCDMEDFWEELEVHYQDSDWRRCR